MDGKISVIIPVYNTEEYLDQCIRSVTGQTYANLEIILVDDGSQDNSYKICEKWANQDDRIVLIQKENGGQSTARNAALEVATGSYFGFVDSDDWIEPDMYEQLYRAIVEAGADAAICRLAPEESVEATDVYRELVRDNIGSQLMRFLFSAKLWDGIRMPIGRYAEDAAVIHKLLCGRKIQPVDRCFYHYNVDNPTSSTNAPTNRMKNNVDRAIVFADRYEWLTENDIDIDSQEIVLSQAVSFFIGTMGIYREERDSKYKTDIERLCAFVKRNYRRLMRSRQLSLARKIAISIICVSPKLYYYIRNLRD